MTIVTLYDHTPALFLSGANAVGDEYILNLYSTLPMNADATTKAEAEVGATQIATANGYTQNAKVVAGLDVSVVDTSAAMLDGTDVTWTASGGSISAGFALLFNNSDTDDPPVLHYDFEGTVTALDGDPFQVIWDATGILYASS
jgi:hypothetical protein